MIIREIETIPVGIPIVPARAVRGSRGAHVKSPFLLVLVHTEEGLTGIGESSCTPVWSGEDSATAAHVVGTYIAPGLVGEDARDVQRLTQFLRASIAANQFTKAAVEMALWDLAGKIAGLPLHQLLGGRIQSHVRTKFSVAAASPPEAAAIATWATETGFDAMKVKVGLAPASDVARVTAVREAIGPDVLLGVDANGGWSRAEARWAIPQLSELGVAFVEQPLTPADLAGAAELRRSSPLQIIADEAVGTAADALAVVRAEAADVLSIYVGMAGGIAGAREVAAVAAAAGLGWTIGSNLEMEIAMAAHLHIASATPGVADASVPCDIISSFYYEGGLLAEPLSISAGRAEPPEGPGLGVVLDPDAVEHFRQD